MGKKLLKKRKEGLYAKFHLPKMRSFLSDPIQSIGFNLQSVCPGKFQEL